MHSFAPHLLVERGRRALAAHAAGLDTHALGAQALALLTKALGTHGKGDPAVRSQHTVPGQVAVVVLAEQPRDQPRAAGQPGATGHLAVAGDLATGYRTDRGQDALRSRVLAGILI